MCPVIVKAPEGDGGGDFEPCPAGMVQGVCAFVVPIGEECSEKFNTWASKVVICFEVGELMSDGRPYMLSNRYTLSLSKKSNLRRDLESWRGREFTDQELKGFDLEKLIGVNCTLNVIHKVKADGHRRASIATIGPAMKGTAKLAVFNTKAPDWIGEAAAKNAQLASMRKAAETAGVNVGKVVDHPPVGFDDEPVPF